VEADVLTDKTPNGRESSQSSVRAGSWVSLVLPLALSLSIVACTPSQDSNLGNAARQGASSSSSQSPEKPHRRGLRVGFSQIENQNPWRIAQTISITAEAARLGIELVYADAQGKTEKQLDDVKYLLAQDIDYLIFDPREYEASVQSMLEAKKFRVPVILVDRSVRGTPGEDYLTQIAPDFSWEGKAAAKWLAKFKRQRARIVEITGTTGSSAAIERHSGFVQALQDYPGMAIVQSQTADFLRAEAQKVMENIIQEASGEFDCVFAHNDEMAIGVIQALKVAGLMPGHDVVVVGIDGTKDALKAIIAGEMGATVTCNPFYGPSTFDAIQKLAAGEKLPYRIVIPDYVIDISNAEEEIKKAF
jgi:ABC-type sugar transport system substrate-binding protein